ncbi:MAG: UvrD-helicase domain-containing protein [Prevotellaceae bacterium]|jgi:DNA helicase-2/ATP-dependent DNA helicase PcrA|nr:UvrD-helicase domain-containing protein [Prevotellaceae bacterium]
MESFLDALNPAQHDAVVNYQGPSLIIAGAGSGKTRVLTYRIAYLLAQGVAPYNILALTFTNKAANEMKARIGQLVGVDKTRRLWMGTFHAIFARILRSEAEHLGFPSSFSIYDTTDSKSVVKSCIKELGLDEKVYKPSSIFGRISMAKNNLITAAAYASNARLLADDAAMRCPRTNEVYRLYAQKCRLSGAMDFDDLLLTTNILLRDFPDVLDKYRRYFRHILVDEYQDTNYAQYLIVKRLADPEQNVSVVGDDAQSIYSFRVARIENILNFKNDYPGYKEYRLEENYRSTQNIVNAANSVIEKNQMRLKKTCFSRAAAGEKIGVIRAYTDQEEAFMVTSAIAQRAREEQESYDEFAILYRTNAQSRVFEEALRRKNIPYKIYGGLSFYQRAEIKDMIAYLRLVTNPNDSEAFKRAVQVPSRGIGDVTMDHLESKALAEEKSIYDTLHQFPAEEIGLRAPAHKRLLEFTALIDELSAQQFQCDAYEYAMNVAKRSGLLAEYNADKTPEGVARYENIEEFFNSVKEFVVTRKEETGEDEPVTIHEYLENVALLTDMDREKESEPKVSLMTVHSAKGLEFRHVFVVGMEESLFPGSMSVYSQDDIEEERRLFYVALTRAKHKATVSFAQSRYNWGKQTSNPPSRFLDDIDDKYLETSISADKCREDESRYVQKQREQTGYEQRPVRRTATLNRPPIPNFRPDDPALIKEGMTIEHERFGRGVVRRIEDAGSNVKALVDFETEGAKTLLLKFARLRIVAQ